MLQVNDTSFEAAVTALARPVSHQGTGLSIPRKSWVRHRFVAVPRVRNQMLGHRVRCIFPGLASVEFNKRRMIRVRGDTSGGTPAQATSLSFSNAPAAFNSASPRLHMKNPDLYCVRLDFGVRGGEAAATATAVTEHSEAPARFAAHSALAGKPGPTAATPGPDTCSSMIHSTRRTTRKGLICDRRCRKRRRVQVEAAAP